MVSAVGPQHSLLTLKRFSGLSVVEQKVSILSEHLGLLLALPLVVRVEEDALQLPPQSVLTLQDPVELRGPELLGDGRVRVHSDPFRVHAVVPVRCLQDGKQVNM